ncbi:Midasin [Lonchura striata]|uniref:Midasin n=1 Tax=Lonchura striata TaxID=40157 RepID=A0A218VCH1_9PASE|nr:Midasin [Lonchura striata domestica]
MAAELRLRLAEPLQLVARRNEKSGVELSRFVAKQVWTQQDRQCILNTLAQLLLDKECTLLIGRQVRPILLDLLERNAEAIKAGGQINHDRHERLCVAMSKLLADHPDVMPFALRYFKTTSPVFQRLFLESSDANTVRYGRRRMKLRDLMEAAYRFLQKEPLVFRELWDWSVCIPLLRSHDTLVRWLLEESQLQNVEQALVLANPDSPFWQKEKGLHYTQGHIVSSDLSPRVVAVCGIVLPRLQHVSEEQENITSSFVLVDSAFTNLQNLAIAVAYQTPVLLEGPIGCGKTSLIDYLAAVTGRAKPPHILKVQLGDQTDSKTLLGMYRCTDVPGEFVWQPGTLTQAVTKGHWILLEDIDYAPLDVVCSFIFALRVVVTLIVITDFTLKSGIDSDNISVLIPLLEKRELLIPGRGDCLKVAPGFQFFATRRIFSCGGGWYRQQSSHAALLDKYWTKIHLDNMSKGELKEVIQRRYPNLALVTDHLLDIFIDLAGDKYQAPDNSAAGSSHMPEAASESRSEHKKANLEGRELSLRDLLNWCSRIAYNFDSNSPTTAVNIFQEVEFFCELYKPEISIREQEVCVGRVTLVKKQNQALTVQRAKHTFAATRPSAVLMEQLAVCVVKGEPVLLVGETGTGKTSAVQYLAHITGHRLRVVNMNQQSDTADLLGGYKPVDNKLIWLPLRECFEELFSQTFSRKKNQTFLGHIQTCYRQKRWHDLLKLMQHIHKSAINKEVKENASGLPLKEKWEAFGLKLNHAHQQMKMTENALLFAFVEGTLAQAVKKGEWVLLDEINLAAAETLECLSGLLEGSSGSLVLLDRGDTEPLVRHPDFRLFACMNPATDVGKRNLPLGIRNRFTELYVEELRNEVDLQILIMDYLRSLNVNKNTVQGIVNFYLSVRKEAETKLVDGTGHRPHYSLRTLCRALRFAASNPCGSIARSLFEQIPKPQGGSFILIEGYWISAGDKEPTVDESYVLTPSVKLNLKDIVRVVSAGTHPVLIQGETSVGKTSLIRWLAAATGNHCVRINNHEHTDIQEYIGCYTSDASGKLVFKEGILIDAMRKGYWVVLDELNLAPTDVLEALNRLLDDNRELFITETQEVVKAHPRFMLFATQNPPGLYGGRKHHESLKRERVEVAVDSQYSWALFRAFRNRFVELHFDELPSAELETILHKRCSLPPSYCSKLVKVMLDLQSYRRGSTVFAGKHGFVTLRDLFRWAERYRLAEQLQKDYDWLQHLANDGFMLLAGRVRKQEEVDVIQNVIEKHFKKKIYPESLFSGESVKKLLAKSSTWMSVMDRDFSHVVWTQGMRRLATLVGRALEFGEPVLLVGDTGCGKTTICQIFAALTNQKLYSVNCHLHMETSDFLGGLRPVRQRSKEQEESDGSRLFEWCDGPLVLAMKEEGFFLLDEISLADDSVLERLNSVLEAEKTLVLAEKGGQDDEENEVELLVAGKKFRILATMNPGGDFGKKELSPALRNRFTEIWCPQSNGRHDLIQIVKHNLHPGLSLGAINHEGEDIAELMMDFVEWLTNQEFGRQCILSVRDILAWVNFMNVMAEDESSSVKGCSHLNISPGMSFIHAACLVYIDGIGSGPVLQRNNMTDYALNAGTTAVNAQRLLRALQLNKPILLEGSPGVGKTSLVAALAKASGNCLVRINLSEQTDVTDLFGTDLPVEGGKGGEFAWRDGPLLAALKAGHWIVLDEVYVDPLSAEDMKFIGSTLFPAIDKTIIAKMVAFNNKIEKEVMAEKKWGQKGGPWEFNLRDLFRWCQLMLVDQSPGCYDPGQHVFLVYGERMRTREDKEMVISVYRDIFGQEADVYTGTREFHISPYNVQIGYSVLSRGSYIPHSGRTLSLLHHSLQSLESIMKCVHMSWMVILVGPAAVGKTSLVELLAHLTGHRLKIMGMNSAMDTTELLGGFEQVDINRPWQRLLEKVESAVTTLVRDSLLLAELCADDAELLLRAWSNFILNYKPKSLGEGGGSVTAELVNKLEGILILTQRLNNKINSYTKAEFAHLVEEFRRFKLQHAQAADCNSHGTFEWVDGMLVQALQSGDWLLMDNVNFCNPSVLDRLNALLEPGGVLTMSERGVIDGTIPTIAPHPNFRLFLSMDPVHGEISRAMRNRGIEIYIPGENDGNIFDSLDLKTLPVTLQDLKKVTQSTNPESLKFSAVEMDANWMDEMEVLQASVKLFIQKATNQDWKLRAKWLNSLAKNLPQVLDSVRIQLEASAVALGCFYASPLSSGVSNMIKLLQPTMTDEHVMPLDPRWNMQILEIIRNSMNFDTEMEHTEQLLMLLKSAANRAVLFLDREKRSYLEKSWIASKKPRNSVLRMSLDFHKNPGSYNCLPHGVVVNLAAFFELWDAFALHWVKSTQVALSDDDTHDDKLGMECFSQLKALSKPLNILELRLACGESRWQEKMCCVKIAATGVKMKKALLQADGLIIRANHVEDVSLGQLQIFLKAVHSQLKAEGVTYSYSEERLPEDISNQLDPALLNQLCSQVQLWPAMEYIGVLWQYKLTADYVAKGCGRRKNCSQDLSACSDLAQFIAFSLKLTPAASHQLSGLWHLLHLNEISPEEMSLLSSQLVNAVLASFWSSTFTTDPDYWLTWRPLPTTEENNFSKSHVNQSMKGPGILTRAVFSKCFFEILSSSSKTTQWDVSGLPVLSSSHVTLGEWMERAQQLHKVSTVLWTNLAVSSIADFRHTDARLQGIMLCRQLSALVDLIPMDLQEEFLECCEKLYLKDLVAYEYLLKILESITDQELLPKEFLFLLLTCLHQFYGEGLQELPEAAWRGSLWVSIGLVQIQMWIPQTRFDPAVKREYKLKYSKEELHQLECEWKTHDFSSQLHTGKSIEDETVSNYIHPHIRLLHERTQKLKEQISSLSRRKAFRPPAPLYDCLYQEAHQYISSIAQISLVQDLLARLLQFLRGERPKSLQAVQNLLNEEASWQQSHHQFRKHLAEEYAVFPDAIIPLQAAILQLQHGMRLVASEANAVLQSSVCPADLNNLLTSLLAFPSVGRAFPTYFARAEILCSVKSVGVLNGLKKFSLKHSEGGSEVAEQPSPTLEQLLVNALLYLQCHVLSRGEMDQKSLQLFRHLCRLIVNEWDEQERRAQEQEAMERSLYRYRSKSHGKGQSEDEEEELEFRRRFPFHEKDFEDITAQPSLEEKMETEDPVEDKLEVDRALLSKSSMQTIMKVHQQLCLNFARSLWYQQSVPSHQAKHYFSTFISCYQTGACLVSQFYPLIGAEMNGSLLGSQLLLSTLLHNTFFEEVTSDLVLQQDGPYDFYQHPNIQQVRQCQPVLDNFAKEIKGLLQEWPEHPVLVQLLVVMDRIRSFPLSSPLSKFLNGLEILLAKAQDWEENASRALSLRKHLDLVTQLIIQWRRLELNCWSVSLDNIMKQHVEKSTKHWFSIYQMIEKYVQDQTEANTEGTEQMDLKTLVSTLQAFIEGSSLGEFHARLQVLLVFHCHVLLMPQVAEKDVLCSILWNLYNYYKQFSECVEAKITELRQPIEKELKEFVKISRWNDVSFWAIKQSVEKIRRTLFKFMKKFEVVLDEPCQPALVEIGKEEQLDCMQKQEESDDKETKIQRLNNTLRKVLSARTDVAKRALPECQGVITFHTESLQYRLSKLTKKMKKMCTAVTENNSYLNLVENLDQFTGGIIVSVAELQSLTFDQTATKEKQKSEAKHIQMQKQRALSDLFKSLAKTGLSYRKGLSWSRSKDCQEVLYLRPLDLCSALAAVDCTHELDATLLSEISSAWDGCQKYFYRSLARHSRLQTALLAPAKDIGLGSIERCKGFTAHLMQMLVRQRRSLTALTEQWILLRNLLSCIQEIDSRLSADREYNAAFPPQDSIQRWTDKLQQLCMQCVMVLEELSWFIQCCPKEESARCNDSERADVKPNVPQCSVPEMGNVLAGIPDLIPSDLKHLSPVTAEQLPPGCRMRNKDQLWLQLATQLTAMLANVKTVKAEVDRVRQQPCETSFYAWRDFEVCTSAVSCLLEVSAQLQSIESLFLPNGQDMEAANQMTLIKSLKYIQEEVNNTSSHFTAWRTQLLASVSDCIGNQQSDEEFVEQFSTKVETVIRAVLYAVQCLVERKQEGGKEEEKSSEENEDAALLDVIKAGHITKLLDEDLSADLEALHVQKAILGVSELLEILKSYREDCTSYKHKFFNQACYLLVRLKPMLCKYSDVILFYLTISLASHRSTGKLLSVLTSIFTELALKGFCLPKELLEDEAGEGATEFHDYEDGGIGEGEGKKDVSDKIESEDQIEDSFQKGKEKEKEDQDSKPDIEGEDNAIEMSEDFEGKMHDGELEKKEDEENSDEEEELDKQMGNLDNAEADDKLDERLWGDDENDDDEDASSKTEETGPGMDEEDSELVAKDDNLGTGNKDTKKQPPKNEEKEQQDEDSGNKEKIHEQIDEREYDENEVDPYHGQPEKEPEVEPLDLPDNLNLESNEKSDDEEDEEEENDFEIDEKPVDLNEADKTEDQNEEDTGETEKDDQDTKAAEEGISEDKEEKEDEGDKDAHDQEEKAGNTEDAEEEEEEEESQPPDEKKKESAEDKGIPNEDQGLQPQEEEDKDNPEMDEEIPEAEERMEHETQGQTGQENLQSDSAVELAGEASERDQSKEESGTGASSANQSEGHESTRMARMASQKQSMKNTQSFKRKPGQADNERSMGDHNEYVHKRLRTMESSSDAKQDTIQPKQNVEEADAFEHIKQGSEHYDAQTYDVASKEQEKPIMPPEEKEEGDCEDAAMETDMQDEDLRAVDTEELKPEKKKSSATKPPGPGDVEPELQTVDSEDVNDSAPEKLLKVAEEKPERSKDSTIHTAHQFLMDIPQEKEAAQLWQKYLVLTAPLSQQLCEQLRLILEPTQAAKLKGDYRTGKRLNMRKVIPYIASQFRKDKIWLRRTKPSKRQYQICLAIDDSSSMIDNHSKQLAYESLAVIGNALTLLEVGQIAVCSFGESVQLLHPFHEQFSDQSGTRILRLCKFQQKKTKIAQFLESSANMFAAAQQLSQNINPETAQLLLIVSDGRGLFLEGKERVTAAVQAARNANIFVIFVVLDNPNSRDSILDIKVPIFKGPGELPEIRSYMEEFPFPFYMILRDVNALPETLSDALRQWFELFLRRQQVLQLYRKILRAIRDVPAEQDRRYLKDWAREEFKRNKDATEEDAIRMMITQGNMQLQELQRTLKLAKS